MNSYWSIFTYLWHPDKPQNRDMWVHHEVDTYSVHHTYEGHTSCLVLGNQCLNLLVWPQTGQVEGCYVNQPDEWETNIIIQIKCMFWESNNDQATYVALSDHATYFCSTHNFMEMLTIKLLTNLITSPNSDIGMIMWHQRFWQLKYGRLHKAFIFMFIISCMGHCTFIILGCKQPDTSLFNNT